MKSANPEDPRAKADHKTKLSGEKKELLSDHHQKLENDPFSYFSKR